MAVLDAAAGENMYEMVDIPGFGKRCGFGWPGNGWLEYTIYLNDLEDLGELLD